MVIILFCDTRQLPLIVYIMMKHGKSILCSLYRIDHNETELVDINNEYGRFVVYIKLYFIVHKTANFLVHTNSSVILKKTFKIGV